MAIEHDAGKQRFVISFGEGPAGTLSYERRGDVIDIYSVFVPPVMRGRGHGARLTIAAFEYARQQGLKVRPTCPFVAGDFLSRFTEYRELVEQR